MTECKAFRAALGRFAADQSGAATVDWVVGTAAAVAFGFTVTEIVAAGAEQLAQNIAGTLAAIEVSAGADAAGGASGGAASH